MDKTSGRRPAGDTGGSVKAMRGRRWYCCPYCGKALFPVSDKTRIAHLQYRCKACKHDLQVNI